LQDEHLWLKKYIFLDGQWLDGQIRPLFLSWDCVEPFEAAMKLQFGSSTHWFPLKSSIWRNMHYKLHSILRSIKNIYIY